MALKVIFFGIGVSLFLSILTIPFIIPFMKRWKFGQAIRSDGPKSHHAKSGTPTMGGVVFSVVALITVILFFTIFREKFIDFNVHIWRLMFLPLIGYALIGFFDDYLIVIRKNNQGLKVKTKLYLQIIIAGIFFWLYLKGDYSTEITIFKNITLDLKWFYGVLIFFMMVGGVNAVNLTDGLDGLAGGLASFVLSAYTFIAFINQQYDVMLFGAAVLGTVLGFLIFNSHPAKIFMGDTGSLTLGAAISTMAVLTKRELLLIIIGGVFVIEALSDIIQVLYFKKTKGKRIFKMAPLHHHFELSGFKESSVVLLFYIFGLLFGIIGVILVLAGF